MVGIGVGVMVGLALGRALGLTLGLGDGDGDGETMGSVGMTVNVGIGDCGEVGEATSLRECAAAIAESSSVAVSPIVATPRRQCALNMRLS